MNSCTNHRHLDGIESGSSNWQLYILIFVQILYYKRLHCFCSSPWLVPIIMDWHTAFLVVMLSLIHSVLLTFLWHISCNTINDTVVSFCTVIG